MTWGEASRFHADTVPAHEARLLLAHVTGASPTEIRLYPERILEPADAFTALWARRLAGEPLQYLLGSWPFMGLDFIVDRRALIPRADTEILAEAALAYIRRLNAPRVLDLCTGGGCIGLALAYYGGARVTAADISADALSLAAENAARLGVEKQVRLVRSDLFAALPREPFDCIVSNPPYIPGGEIPGLQTEVRNHEPWLALDGGPDGLDFYRRIIPQSRDYLRAGGAVFLEVGPGAGVRGLLREFGFDGITTLPDYAGLERVVWAMRKDGCLV